MGGVSLCRLVNTDSAKQAFGLRAADSMCHEELCQRLEKSLNGIQYAGLASVGRAIL